MKLVALMPARNEAWCLGLTARAALMWCDALILLDHASTDATPDIITEVFAEHPGRVYRFRWDGTTWDEMRHRQYMLDEARAMARGAGASHIAIVDADEILTGNLINIHTGLNRTRPLPDGILQLPGYNLRGGLHQYHATGLWANRWFSTAFRDDPALRWQGDRFHHREPTGKTLQPYRPIAQGQGGVMHLWGVSERRLRAKHALYKLTERLRWPDKPVAEIDRMYSWWRSPCDVGPKEPRWTYAPVPDAWWQPYAHLMRYLDLDAEPWQEDECRRLVEQEQWKPPQTNRFAGLDLFGVA